MTKSEINPTEPNGRAAVCGASTKEGPCPEAAEAGQRRCRLHGGAEGAGAPSGERNGRYVVGLHTKEAKAERKWVRDMLNGRSVNVANKEGEDAAAIGSPRSRVRALVYKEAASAQRLARSPVGQEHTEWRRQLKAALGTSSGPFVDAALARLLAASILPGSYIPTSTSVSAALAIVESMKPENELQAALAVDAACLHAAATNMLSRLVSHIPESRMRAASNAAARLERAFHSAVQTYHKLKHGNRQIIRIERIEVRDGGQAVIDVR